jgi:uncharacterized membrane protein
MQKSGCAFSLARIILIGLITAVIHWVCDTYHIDPIGYVLGKIDKKHEKKI